MERQHGDLDARMALAEIHRAGRRAWSGSLRAAWLWLAMAAVTVVFCVFAPPVTTGVAGAVIAFGFPLAGLALLVTSARQHVIGHPQSRLEWPVTWTYVGLVVADSTFKLAASPGGLSVPLILLGSLPVLPCLYAAWRVWRG